MKSNYRLALTLGAAILAAATSLRADEAEGTNETNLPPPVARTDQNFLGDPKDYYRGNELSFDAIGTGSLGAYTLNRISTQKVRQNIKFGAGAGINYFVTRQVGFGVAANTQNTTGTFIDNLSVNLILRLPLGQSGFAPYFFGGGGHQFDAAKLWFGQAGTGVEYRFTRHFGAFLDVCAVWPNETKFYGVGRLGLRFAF